MIVLIFSSGKLVSSLNDILKQSNTKFKPHRFESKFKADMLEKWNDEFNIMWEANKLTERLTTLNALKQQQQQSGTIGKAWYDFFKAISNCLKYEIPSNALLICKCREKKKLCTCVFVWLSFCHFYNK